MEQRRIVDVVSAVDAVVAALTNELNAATASMTSARLALLTIGPSGQWQHGLCSADAVTHWTKALPDDWGAETIGSISVVRSGATPRRSEQSRYFDDGDIPWVKTGDLNETVLETTQECITSVALAETSVRIIPAGTVLVAMYGGFGQIGRTAILGVDAATNQAISALTDLRADVLPAFLHEVLKAGRPKWRRVAASSRKDPNISKRDIEDFDVPVPPMDQQRQIVDLLRAIQAGIDALSHELGALRVFRSSLLADLLTQSVSVPESYDDVVNTAGGRLVSGFSESSTVQAWLVERLVAFRLGPRAGQGPASGARRRCWSRSG